MADFFKAEAITGAAEGPWNHVKGDRGGETLCGVARNFWTDWVVWRYIDYCHYEAPNKHIFPKNIDYVGLKPYLHAFYKEHFWGKIQGDKLTNQHQANLLYDVAVNMGVGYASSCFQRALNSMNRQGSDYPDIEVDGGIGRETLSALTKLYSKRGLKGELSLMFGFYCHVGVRWYGIAERKPSQEKFINGWYWRGVTNIKHIAENYI